MSIRRINDYAVVGDGRTVALISRWGSVDWLCWPHIDGASVFGALLDHERGGAFSLRPNGHFDAEHCYLEASNVLRTRWHGRDGEAEVVDFMSIPPLRSDGKVHPESALVRRVHCRRGQVALRVHFDPRPNYGRRRARIRRHARLGSRVDVGVGMIVLQSSRDVHWRTDTEGWLLLSEGERADFVLTFASEAPAVTPPPTEFAEGSLRTTHAFWKRWASRVRYDGPWREEVVRSALALKLMLFAPSGAVVAAPTTSLPERMGGDLNWDYRFCWMRDSALTVRSLFSLGFEEEADAYVSWLLHSTRLTRPEVRVLYDIWGEVPKGEEHLEHWRGFRGSRPVRIRNAALDQLQLDPYGELVDSVTQFVRHGGHLDRETARMLSDFGEYVCRNWERPDQGIWEPRGPPQHFLHSKVLCWVTLDRLLELNERHEMRRMPQHLFEKNRELLREQICTRGWNPRLQSYVQTLDGERLDASILLLGWYGFHDPHSPRIRSTLRAIERRLMPAPGLLYRYEQSLESGEGAFLICSFWCAELLARGGGTLEEAEDFFKRALDYANDVGLLAEEVDPETGEHLGNFPQAFSHIGLIGAALAIEERRREQRTGAEGVAR